MFLDSYIDEINRLCENHKVRQLFAFGSVLNSKFTNDSDVDFVVDFNTSDPIEYAENYFALKFALEELLNRPIDLMEQKAIRNKYLALSINNSKKIIYEA
jgi:predicted nucleotidyltransferase